MRRHPRGRSASARGLAASSSGNVWRAAEPYALLRRGGSTHVSRAVLCSQPSQISNLINAVAVRGVRRAVRFAAVSQTFEVGCYSVWQTASAV